MQMDAAIYVIQYVNSLFFTFKFFVWFVMLLTKTMQEKPHLFQFVPNEKQVLFVFHCCTYFSFISLPYLFTISIFPPGQGSQ